jgi:pimeloyl-ACP methyl ester carboxylesterase
MLRLALTAFAFLVSALAPAAHAQSQAPNRFQPGPCIERFASSYRIECGTLTVEETRGSNNGRTVRLPVVIVRSTAVDRKPDPVIFLHGGPGGGVVTGLSDMLESFRVTRDRDWIFFDQRGGEASVPALDCGVAPLSDAGVTSDAGVAQLRACGERLRREGVDLSQYNSAVIVKDIADLRAALGIHAYNIFGVSYGGRVAMAVMQHDPTDIRSVVLDSPWPPHGNATGPLGPLVSREVRQILAMCAADADCNARHPRLEARFDTQLATWVRRPRSGRPQMAGEVGAFLLDQIYDSDGARLLPDSIERILKADFRRLNRFMTVQSGYVEGQFFAHLCREDFPFESKAAVQGLPGNPSASDPIAAAIALDAARFFDVCPAFNVGAPDPVENQRLVSDIPTLVLSAELDAGCPADLARDAARTLSRSQYFAFPNRTHGVSYDSPCANGMMAAFLGDPLARIDSSCLPADQPRFRFIEPGG